MRCMPPVSITLSPAQVDEVVRAASGSPSASLSALLERGGAARPRPLTGSGPPPASAEAEGACDRRLSRSLMRGLSLLESLGRDDQPRGIVEIARDLDMSASTAHRYAVTLVELGLIERCPTTRKYRLPRSPAA